MEGNRSPSGRPSSAAPERFEATIGNGRDGYYAVRLLDTGDLLWTFESGLPDEPAETVVPGRSAWAAFATVLERIGVFDWRPNYENPAVVDGTYWSIELSWNERTVIASGANAYPPGFDEFCNAVEVLFEGRTFR